MIPLGKANPPCGLGIGLEQHLRAVACHLGEIGGGIAHGKSMGKERVSLSVEAAMLDSTAFQAPLPVLPDLIVVDAPVGSRREEDQTIALI